MTTQSTPAATAIKRTPAPSCPVSCAVDEKPKRFNWHRVLTWSLLGVAIVGVMNTQFRKDGRVITIFTEEGRDALRTFCRYNFPEFADRMGFNER